MSERFMKNKISIIVPVYNSESTLNHCIDSVINQTIDGWELLLINDGSTDCSGRICEEYCMNDSRIRVIHKKNEGVSVARNVGIENSKGEYVIFLDSDDYLEKNALETALRAGETYAADVVMFGFYYHFNDNNLVKSNKVNNFFCGDNECFVENVFSEVFCKELLNPPWNKLIKKAILLQEQIQFISEFSICEDMIFTLEVLEKSKKIIFLEEPLYHYIYKKGNNLVNKFHANYYEALSFYISKVKPYLRNFGAEKDVVLIMNTFFVNQTIAYFKKIYGNEGYSKEEKYNELVRICKDICFSCSLVDYIPIGIKKKIVCWCIKNKQYRLLHFLYAEILCR